MALFVYVGPKNGYSPDLFARDKQRIYNKTALQKEIIEYKKWPWTTIK